MFFYSTGVIGNLLPEKTLCLTFDDGPELTATSGTGPRTYDLGFYLFLNGIPGTFFVIGERALANLDLLGQLARWGHLVVNHTQTHAGLPDESAGERVADVLNCEVSIAPVTNPDGLLLRPPYGAWSAQVAESLNRDANARRWTGPIMWDIGGNDWEFWKNGQTAEACAQSYFEQIQQARKGIVLMHDSSAEPDLAAANETYQMTRLLLPRLLEEGYRFIRLDAVPQVRSAMLVRAVIGLRAGTGYYVSPQNGGGGAILANGPSLYAWEELGIIELGGGQIALRMPNGQFMSAQPSGPVLANGDGIYAWEVFDRQTSQNGFVAFRAHTGMYISAPNTGQITASANSIGPSEEFAVEYVA